MSAPTGDSSIETVRRVAALARLSIDDREAVDLAAQFERILAQFQVLSQLDVEGVEPMTGPSQSSNVLREDRPEPSLPLESVLANAPQREGEFYGVPKTVGGEE